MEGFINYLREHKNYSNLYTFCAKKMKYKKFSGYYSSLVDLDSSIFKNDDSILDKIKNDLKVENIDRLNEITFGLKVKGLPPTLIHPLPKMNFVFRKNDGIKLETEVNPDMTYIMFQNFDYETIYNAIINGTTLNLEVKQ